MSGVHRNDVRVAATEQYAGSLAWFHDPAAAVDKAIGMSDGVANLGWRAFVICVDDCLGDATRQLLGVIRL